MLECVGIGGNMENPKKQAAREAMEDAYIQLLRKKPMERIGVKELCERAGVNRSTFYAHYLDIYDLAEKVQNRFLGQLFTELVQTLGDPNLKAGSDTAKPLIDKALSITLENRDYCRLLLRGRTGFSTALTEQVLAWSMERYRTFSNNRNPNAALGYRLLIGGALFLWYDWILSDFQIPTEQLTDTIADYLNLNIVHIWQTIE